MAGGNDEDASRSNTPPGRAGSRADSSFVSPTQTGSQRGRTTSRQNVGVGSTGRPGVEQQDTKNMPPPPTEKPSSSSSATDPKRSSWAAMAAHGTTAKTLSMRSTSRSSTPLRAALTATTPESLSSQAASPAPARLDNILEQDSTPEPVSKDPSISRQDRSRPRRRSRDSGPCNTSAPIHQPDRLTSESSLATDAPAKLERLLAIKSDLRELAETHGLPNILTEHLAGDESETTLTLVKALFKDFASKSSEECSARDIKLQNTKLELDASTLAQAKLEKEKAALEEAGREKDAKLEVLGSVEQARQACESSLKDLETRIKGCTAERDEAASELREARKKLKAAEDERNEKDFAMQKIRLALEDAQQSYQETTLRTDVQDLKATISDLHNELRDVKSDKAELERQFERARAAQKHKDDETAAQLRHQDQILKEMQDNNEKNEHLIQVLQHEKAEQLREASLVKAERGSVTFKVDNEIVPLDKYEKLLDNARGDIVQLEKRLEQEEQDHEARIQQEMTMGEVRSLLEELTGYYARGAEEATHNMLNTWKEEDARLLALAGGGGYRRYLHATVEPDHRPSQTSSDGFIAQGELVADIREFGSQDPQPVGQNLASELGGFRRGSSMDSEDTQAGRGDGSAELCKALDECQTRRDEADKKVEHLEDETKKQKNDICELKDEIRKLKEAADANGDRTEGIDALKSGIRTLTQYRADHEDAGNPLKAQLQGVSAIELRDKQADLDECQAHRKKAGQQIEQLKADAKRRSKELRSLEDKLALQQRMNELLKGQLKAVQGKASKAEAKAKWAEARVILGTEGAGGEEPQGSSIAVPEEHDEPLSNLFHRVEAAESQLGEKHRELADNQNLAFALQVRIEQLETQRGHLEQERKQLQYDLNLHAVSGQDVEQRGIDLKEELTNKEEELREKEKEIREECDELKHKGQETKKKQKALDDCLADGEALMKQIAELEENYDDESDCESLGDERQKEIDCLEEQVADLTLKLKAAEYNARNEAARRREVEDKGVWQGTSGAALQSKQTELDNFKKDYEYGVQLFKRDIKSLKEQIKALKENSHADNDSELEMIKFEHQQTVDELNAKLEAADENSHGNCHAELERIKLEHEKAMDELEAKLAASKIMQEIYQERLLKTPPPPPDREPIQKPILEDAFTQTEEMPEQWTMMPTAITPHGPTQTYSDAYHRFQKRITRDICRQRTTLTLLDCHLRQIERLHNELRFQVDGSRTPRPSEETQTADPLETSASLLEDSKQSSFLEDYVPDLSLTASIIENDRVIGFRGITEARQILNDLRVQKERFWDNEIFTVQALSALDIEIATLEMRLKGIEANERQEIKERAEADEPEETVVLDNGDDLPDYESDLEKHENSHYEGQQHRTGEVNTRHQDELEQKSKGEPDSKNKEESDESDESDEGSEESDDDGQDPGSDPVAIRKRIAKLKKKVNNTARFLKWEEKAIRRAIDKSAPIFAQFLDDFGNPSEPRRHKDQADRAEAANNAAVAASDTDTASGTAAARLPPYFSMSNLPGGQGARGGRPRVHDFTDGDHGTSDGSSDDDGGSEGDENQAPRHLKPQEARVRTVQGQMSRVQLLADACADALDDIYRAEEHLKPADDPVPRNRRRGRRSRSPSPTRSITPAEQAEKEEEEARRAFISDNAFDDSVSEASSIVSGDVFGNGGNPNRILKSFLPASINDALIDWEVRTMKLLVNVEMLQREVEGLIHTGVNSQNSEYLRGRARRLRKQLAYAASTNAKLRAKRPRGLVAHTDGELLEMVRNLKHDNNRLTEQSMAAVQAIRDRDAQVGRQRQLEGQLARARADADTEKSCKERLAKEKEQLEGATKQLEDTKEEAIQGSLDKRMRETLLFNAALIKKADRLEKEVAELGERLTDELLTKSAQLETAQTVIQGMADRLREAQRRVEVAEDMRSTLITDVELALDIDAESDTESLRRTRLRISNILYQIKDEREKPTDGPDNGPDGVATSGQSTENARDEKQNEEADQIATNKQHAETARERELIQEIWDQKKKGAEQLAAQKKRYEERIKKRHAEHEKQTHDWEDMYDKAEASRRLSERNRIDAIERIGFLEGRIKWAEGLNKLLDGKLEEQCTLNQELTEELYGANERDGEDGLGEDQTADVHEASHGDPGDGPDAGSDGSEGERGRKPRGPREPQEQPGGAAGGDPEDDPGDDSSDDRPDDSPDRNPRGRRRCTCPCVGLCDSPENPVFDGLPAGAQDVVTELGKVYKAYRECCGKRAEDADGNITGGPAAAGTPEDDGLLLWRLMGVMRADTDIREQIRNADRRYISRLVLASWGCLWIRFISWRQTLFSVSHGFLYYAMFFLPDSRWRPREPVPLPPKRLAIVLKDAIILSLFYHMYRALMATWAAQKIWAMANGYTRAYFIERGLHPQRSRWFGIDGIDMRLPEFSGEPGTLPHSTGVGEGATT